MTAEETANDHWSYVSALLVAHGEDERTVAKIEFHYISAFVHGWKHAEEKWSIVK
jgi:hypothetical protein